VLPPNGLPPNVLPLDPDERPAKGEAPPEPPKVSLGGAAVAAVDEEGEANELSEGLPAARDPNPLPPCEPPIEAKGDAPDESFPKPDEAKALADVSG
jgi:hypothetical protein